MKSLYAADIRENQSVDDLFLVAHEESRRDQGRQ